MKQGTRKITPDTLVQYQQIQSLKDSRSTDPTTTTVTSTTVTGMGFRTKQRR